jgi:hypothetical protein
MRKASAQVSVVEVVSWPASQRSKTWGLVDLKERVGTYDVLELELAEKRIFCGGILVEGTRGENWKEIFGDRFSCFWKVEVRFDLWLIYDSFFRYPTARLGVQRRN